MHLTQLTTSKRIQDEIVNLLDAVWSECPLEQAVLFFKELAFYDLCSTEVVTGFSEVSNEIAHRIKTNRLHRVPLIDADLYELSSRFTIEYLIDRAYGRVVGEAETVSIEEKLKPCSEEGFRKFNHRILYFRSEKLLAVLKMDKFSALPTSDGILAYGYIDRSAGLSFRALCCANISKSGSMQLGPFNEMASLAIRADMVRDAQYVDMLDTNTDLSIFSDVISYTKMIYEDGLPASILEMRDFKFLDPFRHPDFPDDIKVFIYSEIFKSEEVWVRCTDTDEEQGLLLGQLLNTPYSDYTCRAGDIVKFHYIKGENGKDFCVCIDENESTAQTCDSGQKTPIKKLWDDIEDYERCNYFSHEIIEYEVNGELIKGTIVSPKNCECFQKEVDISKGFTIPDWFDTYPEDEATGDVIAIERNAFSELQELQKITIPDGVVVICKGAFSECRQLHSAELPETIKYVSKEAFLNCQNLASIQFPDGLEMISCEAFWNTGLTSIIIPESVQWIGYSAFSHCKNLEHIILLNPKLKIDGDAFHDCPKVRHVTAPMSLAIQLMGQFSDADIQPIYHWLDSPAETGKKQAIICDITQVCAAQYTDGTAGTTVKFELTNIYDHEIVLDVKKIFSMQQNKIKFHDFWLADHIVRNLSVAPSQKVSCAAIFDSDTLPTESVNNSALGIIFTIDEERIAEYGESDQWDIYDGADTWPGYWDDVMSFERYGYYGALFKRDGSKWDLHFADVPESSAAVSNTVPEIMFADFVVRVSLFRCLHNHTIEPIQAFVNVLVPDGAVVREQVSAGYCRECHCYFILEQDFLLLQNKGRLLCQLITEKEYLSKGNSIFSGIDMKAESVLRRCGYTVNAKDDLSVQQRQGILVQVVENGIYSVSELCAFLDWLIEYQGRSRARNMQPAISKWIADRNFICDYKMGARRQVEISGIAYRE